MKYFIVAGIFVALAVVIRPMVSQRFGVDIYIHDTYWVVPVRKITFWLLIAVASVSFLIAAYKFMRHGSCVFVFGCLGGGTLAFCPLFRFPLP